MKKIQDIFLTCNEIKVTSKLCYISNTPKNDKCENSYFGDETLEFDGLVFIYTSIFRRKI